MQKLINVLALVSFAVSAGIVAGGAYVYTQKDALIESAKEKVTKEIQGIIGGALEGALGGGLNSSIPGSEVPTTLPAPVPNAPF